MSYDLARKKVKSFLVWQLQCIPSIEAKISWISEITVDIIGVNHFVFFCLFFGSGLLLVKWCSLGANDSCRSFRPYLFYWTLWMSSVMLEQKLSGKSWLKICSSRWDCTHCSPHPPPRSSKLDWIRKEKIFIFFTQKINWKKNLATYYWVQSHTYTKIWSYEVLCCSCSAPPPNHQSSKLDWIREEIIFIFFTQKIKKKKKKKKILWPGKSVCWPRCQPI